MHDQAPELPAFVVEAEPHRVAVWCDWCRIWHYHGNAPGHRAPHCKVPGSPYKKTGYILQIEGNLSKSARFILEKALNSEKEIPARVSAPSRHPRSHGLFLVEPGENMINGLAEFALRLLLLACREHASPSVIEFMRACEGLYEILDEHRSGDVNKHFQTEIDLSLGRFNFALRRSQARDRHVWEKLERSFLKRVA